MVGRKVKVVIGSIIILVVVAWIARPFIITILNPNLPHQMHAQFTGEDAISDSTSYNVVGTDLGIIVKHGGQYYYIFGDTFGAETSWGNAWRSNTIAISNDIDPSDGITINTWIVEPTWGYAKELISSLKEDNVEMTCIPTAAVSFGGNLYIYYMSVRHWSETGGIWTCNNASIAVSTNDGQTFSKVSNISWAGDSNFIQFGVAQDSHLTLDSNYLYLLATPSGRFGACYLCRVNKTHLLNQSAYEYYSGLSPSEEPIWTTNHNSAEAVFTAPVGEMSVMWNPYLEKWTAFYTDNEEFAIVIRTADCLWGPWSAPKTIVDGTEYPSLYGSFVHPDLVEENGKIVYFIMSIFSEYNTYVMSVDLTSLAEN